MPNTHSVEGEPSGNQRHLRDHSELPDALVASVIDFEGMQRVREDRQLQIQIPKAEDVSAVNKNALIRHPRSTEPLHFDKIGLITEYSRYDIRKPESRRLFNRLLTQRLSSVKGYSDKGVKRVDLLQEMFIGSWDERIKLLDSAERELNTILPTNTPIIVPGQTHGVSTLLFNPKITLHPVAEEGVSRLSPEMIKQRAESLDSLERSMNASVQPVNEYVSSKLGPELTKGSQLVPLLENYFMRDGHLFVFGPTTIPRTKEQVAAYYDAAVRQRNIAAAKNTRGPEGIKRIDARLTVFKELLIRAVHEQRRNR